MRKLTRGQAHFSYPAVPKMVLLEQPWQLARDDWGAEDPTRARSMLEQLLAYAEKNGIPVFSTHSGKADFPGAERFSKAHGITPINIRAISARGYMLDDIIDLKSFISQLMDGRQSPIIVGGAHAHTGAASGIARVLEQAGIINPVIDGLCILEPLRFLFAMKESGLLDSPVFLDPRLIIQIDGPRMDEARLYEVIGAIPDSDSFRIRPSHRV